MAVFSAFVIPPVTTPFAGRCGTARGGFPVLRGAVTTISYFTAAGVFGTTTDPAAVPPTAGIVARETT
jgi:hypothetical protein